MARPTSILVLVSVFLVTSAINGVADVTSRITKVHDINGHALLKKQMKDDWYAVGKVVNMTAGEFPVKRVKIKTSAVLRDGYCFATDSEIACFWYTPTDVIEDDTWFDFDPNYDLSEPGSDKGDTQ